MRRALLLVVPVLLSTILLLSCAPAAPAAPAQPKAPVVPQVPATPAVPAAPATVAKTKRLAVGGASLGGTIFIMAAGIADMITKYVPGTEAVGLITKGGVENMMRVQTKELDLAIVASSACLDARDSKAQFKEKPASDVRILGMGHANARWPVTLKGRGVTSFADLRGKTVNLGAAGSTSVDMTLLVLQVHGLTAKDVKPVYMGYSQAVAALKDGTIDFTFIAGGRTNIAAMEELLATEAAKVLYLTIAEDKRNSIVKAAPYYFWELAPAGVYKGQTQPVWTLLDANAVIVHKNADERLVYEITKAIYDHTDELAEIHPAGAEYKVTTALTAALLPIHRGAVKYYQEKGVWDKRPSGVGSVD